MARAIRSTGAILELLEPIELTYQSPLDGNDVELLVAREAGAEDLEE